MCGVNVLLFRPIGYLADKIPPKITLPLAALSVGLITCSMMFIQSPTGFKCYLIWSLMSIGFVFQGVSLEGYFSKNIPKEVRGVMAGFLAFCGLIGRAICFKLGGTLFKMGRAMPFIMIGMSNFIFVLFLLVMLFLGLFGREDKK